MLLDSWKNVHIHEATMVVAALLLTQLSSARFPFSCLPQNLMRRLPQSEQLDMKQATFRPDVSVSLVQKASRVHIYRFKQTKQNQQPHSDT